MANYAEPKPKQFKNNSDRERLYHALSEVLKSHRCIKKKDVLFVLRLLKKSYLEGKL